MAISSSSIIDLATPTNKIDVPGICDQVRDRLEWTWGLGHNHLDEHLEGFTDPEHIFLDRSLLVFTHSDMIRQVLSRNSKTKPGVPRPHIQKLYKGRTSFQYLVVPIDPFSEVPARTIVSNVPPHLALCTTSGKIMKAWGRMKGEAYTAVRLSVVERAKSAIFHDRPALSLDDLDYMRIIHRTWSFGDYVPPAFLSEDSDQTMVAVEESSDSKSDSGFSSNMGAKWEVGSSASCYHEPKRRLLPSELYPDAPTTDVRLFPSENGDADDAISSDSHSGVEDSEEFSKANVDHEMDTWLKYWAEETAEADTGELLLNDAQIEEDPKEQPRVAASLDLTKPDYLSRHKRRTTT